MSTEIGSSSSVNKLRDCAITSKVIEEVRLIVLRGSFSSLKSTIVWRTPTFKLLVFVSSTFTDMKLERDYFMDILQFE